MTSLPNLLETLYTVAISFQVICLIFIEVEVWTSNNLMIFINDTSDDKGEKDQLSHQSTSGKKQINL